MPSGRSGRGRPNAPRQTSLSPVPPLAFPPTEGEGFINPYNFVRVACFAPARRIPCTHEKFAGLSGRIICQLETLTPLCAPDAEASHEFPMQRERDDERHHEEDKTRWRKHFSRLADGTPYIAGASLKGMLRSVAEAASNSCFSILTNELAVFRDNRDHFTRPQAGRRIGQISKRSGALEFADLYDSSRRFIPSGPNRGYPNTNHNDPLLVKGMFGDCGMDRLPPRPRTYRVAIRRGAAGRPHPNRTASLSAETKDLYDKLTKKLVREPHSEDRCTPSRRNMAYAPEDSPAGDRRPWLADYIASAQHEVYVWGQVSNSRAPGSALSFGRNFRYKWAYEPRAALDAAFHPCRKPDEVCPCCDLFGMVEERDETRAAGRSEVNALAGKVSISAARWTGGRCEMFWLSDPRILNTPKYSCRSFYLYPDTGSFDVSRDEYVRAIGGRILPNPLRGRKFYWHHTRVCDSVWTPEDWIAYLSRREKDDGARPPETELNAEIEALLPGARFEFTVEFENLTSFQLGLLLWTLALPGVLGGGAHHLGLGKPLGLGSISVRVRSVEIINRARRYASIFETGVETVAATDPNDPEATIKIEAAPLAAYLAAFHQQMEVQSGGTPFDELPNIADLRVILSREQPAQATLPPRLRATDEQGEAVPITYPPGPHVATNYKEPHPEELHYNWYGTKGKKWSERLLTIQEIARGCRQTLVR